jgi:putative peptidoglycan lipid II flippase
MTQLGMPTITALAIGAVVGSAMHAAANALALRGEDLLPRPRLGFSDPDVRRALSLMVPLLAGLGIHQLNILLARLFASFLPAGSQSYLSYGLRVVEIPQGMFAIAIAAATLPTLSRLRSEGRDQELLELFRYTLRMSAFVAIPASVALGCLAAPTIATLFGRGAFGPEQVAETARSMTYQALGICAVAGVRAVVPVFSAHHDTRSPVLCSGLSLVTFIVSATLLMDSMGHAGLALATTLAATVQLVAMLMAMRRHLGPLHLSTLSGSLARTLAAASIMGAAVYALAAAADLQSRPELPRVGLYLGIVAAGGLIYFAAARALGSAELTELLATVRQRGRNTAKNP